MKTTLFTQGFTIENGDDRCIQVYFNHEDFCTIELFGNGKSKPEKLLLEFKEMKALKKIFESTNYIFNQ